MKESILNKKDHNKEEFLDAIIGIRITALDVKFE